MWDLRGPTTILSRSHGPPIIFFFRAEKARLKTPLIADGSFRIIRTKVRFDRTVIVEVVS